jgi:hypothetical protein
MSRIEFEVLWTDDDGMLQLGIAASSSTHTAYHETYVYPKGLSEFATSLLSFPANLKAEAILECGSKDPQWHDYLRLRVFVLKPTGHSAMEVDSDVRGAPPVCATTHFYATGEPADFNRLGAEILKWLDDPAARLVVEWRDA